MRLNSIICAASVALLATTTAAAATRIHAAKGRVSGQTKIDLGCPVSPGSPCNAWQPLPHAVFTVTRLNHAGTKVPGTARTVESNAAARFRIPLRAGDYLVKASAGRDSKGEAPFRLRVRANATTVTTVRFTSTHPRA